MMMTDMVTGLMEPGTAKFGNQKAESLYTGLYSGPTSKAQQQSAREYLYECLQQVVGTPSDLPEDEAGLASWIQGRHEAVGQQYLDYLQQREAGAPRRYFSNRAHALYFFRGVAPTKLVDGSWLYGLLGQWGDDRYRGLIRIYLEELGDGVAQENHVGMFRRLLVTNGCEHNLNLSDEHYVQGAIQLSLARAASHFTPEVVGFNLGYEQLPLHLLITAYELKELNVDPYYFQVHVTVDNAGTGHARKALDAVRHLRPVMATSKNYYERVRRGYLLNDLGASTISVIQSFDLEAEMVRILAEKSVHGRHMHSNAAVIGGRTVNDWLSCVQDIPQFLAELERCGWIKRNCHPSYSRLRRLLDEGQDMFGVFSAYERQVMHDWIQGDAPSEPVQPAGTARDSKPDRGLLRRVLPVALSSDEPHLSGEAEGDFSAEMRDFEEHLVQARNRHDLMKRLICLMDPSVHHTPVGIRATRMFSRLLDAA